MDKLIELKKIKNNLTLAKEILIKLNNNYNDLLSKKHDNISSIAAIDPKEIHEKYRYKRFKSSMLACVIALLTFISAIFNVIPYFSLRAFIYIIAPFINLIYANHCDLQEKKEIENLNNGSIANNNGNLEDELEIQYNEVCEVREYYYSLEKQYNDILESLNSQEKALYDEYLEHISKIQGDVNISTGNTLVKNLVKPGDEYE